MNTQPNPFAPKANPYWNPQGNIPGVPQAQPLPSPTMSPGPGIAPSAGAPDAASPDAFAGLDPSLVQAMLSLQGQSPEQAKLKRQLARADALRGAAPAMMQGQGGMPNYLGAIASVMASRKADQLDKQAEAAGANLAQERRTAAQSYFDALRQQKAKSMLSSEPE